MYLKKCWKYLLYITIALIIIISFIHTGTHTGIKNETIYFTIFSLKIYDMGSLVALIVGILAFFGTIYSVDKNYKAMKLSSLPDKSANLLIDLEFSFNEYDLKKKYGEEDEFILLIEILKYWKEHQKAFRLLTPHFYKEFLKIITNEYYTKYNIKKSKFNEYDKSSGNELKINNTENDIKYSNDNSIYIIKAIIAQITNIAFENDKGYFSFIKPNLIKDTTDIKEIGAYPDNYKEFKISKSNFERYIDEIEGDETRELTSDKFKNLNKKFKNLLEDLKREIEEYD